MPTFTSHGPFVPDQLVQDLEDDRVVLFCGAGVSMDAGLPSYAGLVQQVYDAMGAALPGKRSPEWLWPDRMLGDLEVRSQPGEVRKAVGRTLSLPPRKLDYHRALLRLARMNNAPGLRLITTNFDTYFEQAAEPALRFGADLHSGPVLPIPRNDQAASWRSIVHLHGRLEPSPHPNDHLVLTSADFGRAYLTEGWAARFVTQLFAGFSVLFVGYSLNDPVLRYMTDAFAAEAAAARRRSLRPPAYIFVSYTGSNSPSPTAWWDRGLEPIFYNAARRHRRLRDTLVAWAAARDDWLSSTVAIIRRYGPHDPSTISPSNASNLVWAVSGRSGDQGFGAKTFAELEPKSAVGWLSELARREDAARSDYAVLTEHLKSRGEPEPPPPPMSLSSLIVNPAVAGTSLSPVAYQLAHWIARHMDSLQAVDWVATQLQGDQRLHPQFRRLIRDCLAENCELSPPLALFWRIVSAEGLWAWRGQDASVWALPRRFTVQAEEPSARAEFLALIRPFLVLAPNTWRLNRAPSGAQDVSDALLVHRFSGIAEAKVDLVGGNVVQLIIDDVDRLPDPEAYLADLADDLTSHLKTALDLFAIVGKANEQDDPGRFAQPSIRPHPQNRRFHRWARLIELLWRAWQYIDARSAAESRRLVERWRSLSYPTFRRMVLQAMSVSVHWIPQEKIEALLDGPANYVPLWSVPLQKEALDLIVAVWDDPYCERLVEAIVAGPPWSEEATDEDHDGQQRRRDRAVFDRLTLLDRQAPPRLPPYGAKELARLQQVYPNWDIEPGDRAHFTFWMELVDGSNIKHDVGQLLGLRGFDLLQTLTEQTEQRGDMLEVWQKAAVERPGRAVAVLGALATRREGGGPADVWRATLWGLRERMDKRSIARRVLSAVANAPDTLLSSPGLVAAVVNALADASKREAEMLPLGAQAYWALWDRLLETALATPDNEEPPEDDDWVFRALNRPVGNLTTTLLNNLFKRGLLTGQGLPLDLRPRLDRLVQSDPSALRLARVILVSRLVYLFAVDRAWVTEDLLPFLDWTQSEDEAAALWRAYAWHAQINVELWDAFADYFLDTFTPNRLAMLDESAAGTLASILMLVGVELSHVDVPVQRVRNAIRKMTPEARSAAASWLSQYLKRDDERIASENRGARADRIWRERVSPWLHRAWPRDRELVEPATSKEFAAIAIATDQAFNEAVEFLLPFMKKAADQWGDTVNKLAGSAHPDDHPFASLLLLERLVSLDHVPLIRKLRAVLERIGSADSELRMHNAYRYFDTALRAAGR